MRIFIFQWKRPIAFRRTRKLARTVCDAALELRCNRPMLNIIRPSCNGMECKKGTKGLAGVRGRKGLRQTQAKHILEQEQDTETQDTRHKTDRHMGTGQYRHKHTHRHTRQRVTKGTDINERIACSRTRQRYRNRHIKREREAESPNDKKICKSREIQFSYKAHKREERVSCFYGSLVTHLLCGNTEAEQERLVCREERFTTEVACLHLLAGSDLAPRKETELAMRTTMEVEKPGEREGRRKQREKREKKRCREREREGGENREKRERKSGREREKRKKHEREKRERRKGGKKGEKSKREKQERKATGKRRGAVVLCAGVCVRVGVLRVRCERVRECDVENRRGSISQHQQPQEQDECKSTSKKKQKSKRNDR